MIFYILFYIITLTIQVSIDDYGLVGYYNFFQGNANDLSGNGFDGEIYGNPILSIDRYGYENNSYMFNGISDYISINCTSGEEGKKGEMDMIDEISIGVWINVKERPVEFVGQIVGKFDVGKNDRQYVLELGTNDKLQFNIRKSDDSSWFSVEDLEMINHDVYYFVVGTFNGNEIKLYRDGKEVNNKKGYNGKINSGTGKPLKISNHDYCFNGVIDDVRIYNRTLSEIEVQELYNLSFDKGLVAHYPFNDGPGDTSGNGNDGIVNGVILMKDRFGLQESAYSFDGESRITIPDNPTLDITKALTISTWIKTSTLTHPGPGIISKYSYYDKQRGYDLMISSWDRCPYPEGNAGRIRFVLSSTLNPPTTTSRCSSVRIDDNQWHHVVALFNPLLSNGNRMKVYIDGVDKTGSIWYFNTEMEVTSIASNNKDIQIGYQYDGKTYFNGLIDDIRIYNRSLSEQEISQLYGNYHQLYEKNNSFPIKLTLLIVGISFIIILFFVIILIVCYIYTKKTNKKQKLQLQINDNDDENFTFPIE